MGDFRRIVEKLVRILIEVNDRNKITPQKLPEILKEVFTQMDRWGGINCYPGFPSDKCYEVAFFISLQSPLYAGKGNLKFHELLEKVIQHFQGKCDGITKYGIIITDNWDAHAFYNWYNNLLNIKRNVHLEIYLICGKKVSEIDI